jgi:glycosyltransferase involved in cell wall biosynthesis
MRATVICTVLNEGESIRRLLDSLVAQTQPPDEVVVVDGGSHDNTVAVIREYGDRLTLRVLEAPGANISRGRNLAIEAAASEVIASTDAGVRLESDWLRRLVAPFQPAPGDGAVAPVACAAGFFVPDPQTTFERAMGATVLPAVEEIRPATFLPSSRSVAFTRQAWTAAGRYPEWLDYCEDLIFDLRLRESVGPWVWVPDAVAHFRPRSSLRSFFRQYYRYARGDGKADLWRRRHLVRYGTYLIVLPAIVGLSLFHSPVWLLALLAGVVAYCRVPYRRLGKHLSPLAPADRLSAVLLIPVIRLVGDVAKMLGYPAGWVWRIRHWDRPEIHWRTR